ncbi:UNVERIFIED_CONTAM: hypothetical protein RMT77_008261 [Armadillidium vulgare]
MKFLFCGLCVFLFVFFMNFNDVSSIPPIRFPNCYLVMGGCPENYKPPPSCLYTRCPSDFYCCYDGCSNRCSPIRKDDDSDIP